MFRLEGKQAGSTLYGTSDGALFYRYKINDAAQYFRCKEFKSGCCVRATFYSVNNELVFSGYHLHPLDPQEAPYRTARRALVREATRLDVASLQEIFNDHSGIHRPFADLLTLRRLQPAMNRARMEALPNCENLIQLVEALQNPTYKCITSVSGDVLFRGSARTQCGSLVAVFMHPVCCDFLRIIPSIHLSNTTVWIQDHGYTVCTISARWDSHALSLAWCVLDSLIIDALHAAFILLRTSLVAWCFKTATCGVEIVSRSFSSVFNVQVDQSIYDYMFDFKNFLENTWTLQAVRETPHLHTIIKLCSTFPLLPRDVLQYGLNIVTAEIHRYNLAEEPNFQQLFNHINERWLKNPRLSVCGSSERTDFSREELKIQLQRRFEGRNSNFYCLTKYMVSSTQKSIEDIMLAAQGRKRKNVVLHPPLSEDNNILVLLQQLTQSSFALEVSVRNLMNVCGEKLSYLFL